MIFDEHSGISRKRWVGGMNQFSILKIKMDRYLMVDDNSIKK
jgi:hypothetical protein